MCLAFFGIGVQAQENLYHHVGDTIVGRSPIYFYEWWNEQAIADSVQLECTSQPPKGYTDALLRYNYTDKPLNIVGLAGAMLSFDIWDREIDSTYYPEYLLLYEADSYGYHGVDSVVWNLRDPYRTLEFPLHLQEWPWGECGGFYLRNKYVKMYEYYFQKPCLVQDSFYVGTTQHSDNAPREIPSSLLTYTNVWCYKGNSASPSDCPPIGLNRYIYRYSDTVEHHYDYGDWDTVTYTMPYEWQCSMLDRIMLIFPIVEVVCSEPSGLEVRMVDSTTYELVWSGDNNVAWEALVVNAADTLAEDAAVWCDTTSFMMTGLDLQTDYRAFVRGICIYEGDTVRTGWMSVPFSTPDTATVGIAEVERLSVSIAPNPTSGRVRVSADEPMRQVAVYDMAGKEVSVTVIDGQQSTADGEWSTDIDLADLPNGTYIVKVATKTRTATRKLIVE